MAASPHTGEVGSRPTSPHPGEVGSEPAAKISTTANIGEEEEEDEDRDTHFQYKRRSSSPVVSPIASPRKKTKKTIRPSGRCRGTIQIRKADAPTVHAPPPAAPICVSPSVPPIAIQVTPATLMLHPLLERF